MTSNDQTTDADREFLGLVFLTYIRAYLQVHLFRRRFGFRRPIEQVALDVADMETAGLLQITTDENGRPSPRRLRDAIERRLAAAGLEIGSPIDLEAVGDDDLASATMESLRYRAQQGAILAWKEDHPQQGLLLRSLKRHIRRIRGLVVRRDARGQIVQASAARERRSPIDLIELISILQDLPLPARVPDAIHALRLHIDDARGRNRFCYLMDLVRAIHFLRIEGMLAESRGRTGASTSIPGPISDDGVPFAVRFDRVAGLLREWAVDILIEDERKRRRRSRQSEAEVKEVDTAEARSIIAEIAVDRIFHPVGLGRPEWAALPLERLIEMQLGEGQARRDYPTITDVDYLIRRLRERLRAGWPRPS